MDRILLLVTVTIIATTAAKAAKLAALQKRAEE